ncbi:MAG: DUF2079 domain-containing protein [Bacteroidetes bacterium]|nr:DUF2079 domain-containing protein [Bacteroidota bacterium]
MKERGTNILDAIKNSLSKPVFYILLFFTIVYILLSYINHINYRTAAFDLGIYNNCLYQYGHFHKNHYPYLHYMFDNFLSDHFSLYTVILSPLHYVFGNETLIYIQIISVLFGAFGVFKIVQFKSNIKFLPEIAMIHYLCFFSIYSALSFDYHDNVISAMLVPWFFYYFISGKNKMAILFAVLIVIGKENMPLWFSFICLGLFLLNYKDRPKRKLAFILSISSIVYALVVIKLIMPNIGTIKHDGGYYHFKYSILGNSLGEMISNFIHHPLKIIKAIYYTHLVGPELRGIKMELYKCLAFSGAVLLLRKPAYILMLVPIVAQKVFSDDFGKWGINVHYSIEFAPIVIIGFYDVLTTIKFDKVKMPLAIMFAILTGYTTYSKMEKRESIYYNRVNGDLFMAKHYTSEFDKDEVKRVMKLIPQDAKLSSLTYFAPHLSFRKDIYQFPDVHDAEYIFIANCELPYPLIASQMNEKINFYLASEEWETVSKDKGIYLFRKR